MRQRITLLQEPQHSVDPKRLEVAQSSIVAKNVFAAREDRITFGFDQLPQELYRVLKASHELHIRWVSTKNFETFSPLLSRLSPGLHVLHTPQRNSTNSLLCPALRKAFGDIDCVSLEVDYLERIVRPRLTLQKSFSKLPCERFSLSAATQYYSPLENIAELVEYVKHKLCQGSEPRCLIRVSSLLQASSVDIDFDTISHALTLSAYWPPQSWDLDLWNKIVNDRLEVGILSVEAPNEVEELSLGGFLTVVGEDTKPSPTLFSFPARHHPTSDTFSSSFLLPTGLHPILELRISGNAPPLGDRSCSLHAHLTLPRGIFADKYQLSNSLLLASKNLTALHYVTVPVDLEAPEYIMDIWGSSVLLELAPPQSKRSSGTWTAQVPLHLRYLQPVSGNSGISPLVVPYPVVFWACIADEGSKFPINPFDRVNLGYDGLFGPKTMFYHLSPEVPGVPSGQQRLINVINVPVLDLDRSENVEVGTAAAVLLGFLWVLWNLYGVWQRNGYGSNARRIVIEKKKL